MQSGTLHRMIAIRRMGSYPQKFYVGPKGTRGSLWVLTKTGTRKMVARGLDLEVERRWKARNKALLDTLKARMAP
jgi:hypothetical protein